MTRTLVLVGLLGLALSACTGGARSGRRPLGGSTAAPAAPAPDAPEDDGASEGPRRAPVVDSPALLEDRYVGRLSKEDFAVFRNDWLLFVRKDRAWPEARARWLARGGAAPYVLAENLLRYFVSASAYGDRRDLNWIAVSAKKVGEPAVGYFGSLLLLDERPLDRPVSVRDSDGKTRELRVWKNDDVMRQHLAMILAGIGEPAVPTLSTEPYLRASAPGARRAVLHALGRIGTDAAVDAAASMLSSSDWQDRGAAAKALGLAIVYAKNERARAPLQRAKDDPDPFVRKKVEEALAGKSRSEF